ncbi:dihydroxyacetone kinase subunit DhaK [Atrimonas thermophila]|uniref:dihydroxyacetone kinase subunit DhaK n=1 Tax=Atrimonas thermophila TaxID=3064161 RepID=UPI00399C7C28
MKKILNVPQNAVPEMLAGMVKAHSRLITLLPGTQAVVRKDAPVKGKVALISGGGSGHEPAHAGYVGRGMLDAALAGAVFAAPPLDDALAALKHCATEQGVLFIIKNYTGDRLLFDMLSEEAEEMGIPTRSVVIADDVAIAEREGTPGRRGVAGTVLIHKIAGARADLGGSLEEVHQVAQKAASWVRSMGVALSPCTLPGSTQPSFTLDEDQIEIGIGIHGEAGVRREKLQPARELTQKLLEKILTDLPYQAGDEVAVLVNGMGSTPLMELYIVFNEAETFLRSKGITIYKALVGEYMTSLDMAGFSITLLKLDAELKELLDHPCLTPCWVQS